MADESDAIETNPTRKAARIALGLMLVFAGTAHLTFARRSFKAQVPPWLPLDPDKVVLQSGAAEITLGSALVLLPHQRERRRPGRCRWCCCLPKPRTEIRCNG